MTQPLSPATQAVLKPAAQAMECPDGFLPYERELMAAALRAAADLVVPDTKARSSHAAVIRRIRRGFLAIAAELEGGPGSSSTH